MGVIRRITHVGIPHFEIDGLLVGLISITDVIRDLVILAGWPGHSVVGHSVARYRRGLNTS